MRYWTFSLTSLLAIMTLLCLDLGAFVADTKLLTSAAYTLFLGLLCFSVAAGFAGPEGNRRFWLGFAAFGVVYWLGLFDTGSGPANSSGVTAWSARGYNVSEPVSSYFITSDLLDLAEELIVPHRSVGAHVFARWQGGGYYWGTILEAEGGQFLIKWDDGSTPTWQTARDISGASLNRRIALHAAIGTLWGILGGAIVAIWAGYKSRQAPATKAPAAL